MKRYDQEYDSTVAWMQESEDGEYVRYEDVAALEKKFEAAMKVVKWARMQCKVRPEETGVMLKNAVEHFDEVMNAKG